MTLIADKTDLAGQYYRLRDAHLRDGDAVPTAIYQLAIAGDYSQAIDALNHLEHTGPHTTDHLGPFAGEVALDGPAAINQALANFAQELHEAGVEQLEHLARRAEMPGDLAHRMQALVDHERARRVITAGLGYQWWAVRQERWEAVGRVGDPGDPEYDDFFYQERGDSRA